MSFKKLVLVHDEMGELPRYVNSDYVPPPYKQSVKHKYLLNPREHRTTYPDFETHFAPTSYACDRTSLDPEPIKELYVIGIEKFS